MYYHYFEHAETLGKVLNCGAQADARSPRIFLVVAVRRLPAAVVCQRLLTVVPKPLPAAPYLVRRRYLVVVPRPLPTEPLAVRRTYLIVVLRPVLRPLPAATRHCRIKRITLGR